MVLRTYRLLTMLCVLKRLREMCQDVASLFSEPMKCIKTPNSGAPSPIHPLCFIGQSSDSMVGPIWALVEPLR